MVYLKQNETNKMTNKLEVGDKCLVICWDARPDTLAAEVPSILGEEVTVTEIIGSHPELGLVVEVDVLIDRSKLSREFAFLSIMLRTVYLNMPASWLLPLKDPGDEEVAEESKSNEAVIA